MWRNKSNYQNIGRSSSAKWVYHKGPGNNHLEYKNQRYVVCVYSLLA